MFRQCRNSNLLQEVDSGADTYVNVAALRQGPDDDVHHCSPANVCHTHAVSSDHDCVKRMSTNTILFHELSKNVYCTHMYIGMQTHDCAIRLQSYTNAEGHVI